MPTSPSPREVAERLYTCMGEGKWNEMGGLYDDDVVIESPFGLVGPKRIEGAQIIRDHLKANETGPMQVKVSNIVVYETTDPELVIVEYDMDGTITTTGRSFQVPNISVLRVRNGKIVSSRDYHNDMVRAQAMGMVEQLVAGLTASEPG